MLENRDQTEIRLRMARYMTLHDNDYRMTEA